MSATRVEIVAVGRELLTGRTQDTNSNWLAARVTALGGLVKRMTAVDDVLEEIAQEVRDALGRGTRLLVTSGGLGPTPDDMTLAAVAAALRLPLVSDGAALEFVAARYSELAEKGFVASAALTPPRRKMAVIPQGGTWFPNTVGIAPAVLVEREPARIYSLPGVPAEMKGIFEARLAEDLCAFLGQRVLVSREVRSGLRDESVVAEAVESAVASAPGVHIKPLPARFGPRVNIPIRLSAAGQRREEVESRLDQAERALKTELARLRRKRS